ncbi:Sod Cu, Reprolysin, Pep M12B propep and/or HMA domain containing protein [Asbolus verrucosus]|uniref:Sod Cu, Reprolysin, Pep M12B propep and/or HMA domain containing protein n=1 Tax=Asbolus verrucosus TaxID=1661398 RepID=A0A482V8G8_ASBVE|nr:Sod Cu, Reprolysin, Pep M12B propep and/or HMA domain containing protein [Asbolus verrucosus]
MPESKIEFAVQMTCDSCVEAVKKALGDEPNIKNVEINLEKGSVVVDTTLPTLTVQKKIETTGRKVVVRGYAGSSAGVAILDTGTPNIQGVIRFVQVTPNSCIIDGTVDGLEPDIDHKLTVYECGDLSQGCDSVGDPYHPNLGVITAEKNGRASFRFEDDGLKLPDIIGRSLVVNDGHKRLVCGVIARSAGLFENPKTICACDGVTIWDEKSKPKSSFIHSSKMLGMLFLVLLPEIRGGEGFAIEALHDYMTEPELAYYFQTGDKSAVPEYEVVYLPELPSSVEALEDADTFDYSFSAFERPIDLKLKKNDRIAASNLKTYLTEGDFVEVLASPPKSCHYIHRDASTVAAISACEPRSMQGLIFLDDTTLEIHPLTERLQSLITEPLVEGSIDDTIPHIVKRASSVYADDEAFPVVENFWNNVREASSHRPAGALTAELAMFFDEAAYKIFAPYLGNDDGKLQDMLLAYMNGVQALYHHPSLGTSIELVLVRLDIMKKQPSSMPHYNGERSKLLDTFCAYQSKLNPSKDSNPDHWDMALYVSGLDFFAYENGRKSGVTMGLAPVGGVCLNEFDCVIAELGTTNVFGKPYPSAGFTSVYILAHEIGHNLGMHHDSVGNSCPKEGYVMSPSRGTNGETQWSHCSAEIMAKLDWAKCLQDSAKNPKHLDHSRFLDSPGQKYTAKKQCEILLRDKDAVVSPSQELSTICYNLQCKTPNRSGYYFAGPALEGTQCGTKKYCFGGDCVSRSPPKPTKVVPGGWGPWKESPCSSGCIEKSRGFQTKKRQCDSPAAINTDQGCQGSSVEFGICKDDKICKSKRLSAVDYASQKCQEFAKLLPELDPKGGGLQAPHEEARVWMGCAIFCRRADSGGYYTPRVELNDLGASPYFPDGTWCHREKNLNYYCLHHHCLPENFHFSKVDVFDGMGGDVSFSQNARPFAVIPPEIKPYFSLGADGKPLKTVLKPHETKNPKEEDWETDDYVIIPQLKERYY